MTVECSNLAYETPVASTNRNDNTNIPTEVSKEEDSNAHYKDPGYKSSPIRPGTNIAIPLEGNVHVEAPRSWVCVELGAEKWIEKKRTK